MSDFPHIAASWRALPRSHCEGREEGEGRGRVGRGEECVWEA